MLVDGGDCMVCVHIDPIEGDCRLHKDKGEKYRGTGMRDSVRECNDFSNVDELFLCIDRENEEKRKNQQIIDEYNAHPKIGDRSAL